MSKVVDTPVAAPVAKRSQISTEVTELAERIAPRLTMDKKTGIAEVPERTYIELLPEGLTEETVQAVHDHTVNMAAASLLALGEASVPVFTKNKDLLDTTLTVPIVGKDFIGVKMNRMDVTNGKDEAGNAIQTTNYGTTQAKLVINGLGRRGDMMKVKRQLAEESQKAFGK